MTDERKLQIGLLSIRLAVAALFLVWTFQKVFAPEMAQRVFQNFYFSAPSVEQLMITGIAQLVIVLAFAAGLFRFWTYGAMLLMHAVSTLSTYERLANPYESPNALFWAAVPVLAAMFALFLLRKQDRLLSLDSLRESRRLRTTAA